MELTKVQSNLNMAISTHGLCTRLPPYLLCLISTLSIFGHNKRKSWRRDPSEVQLSIKMVRAVKSTQDDPGITEPRRNGTLTHQPIYEGLKSVFIMWISLRHSHILSKRWDLSLCEFVSTFCLSPALSSVRDRTSFSFLSSHFWFCPSVLLIWMCLLRCAFWTVLYWYFSHWRRSLFALVSLTFSFTSASVVNIAIPAMFSITFPFC